MVQLTFGQQGTKLLPDRLYVMYGEIAGMSILLRIGKL